MPCPPSSAPSEVLDEVERGRLFSSPDIGMLSVDAHGHIKDVNSFLSELLMYSADELRGKSLWEISPSLPAGGAQHAMDQLGRSGHLRHSELPLSSKDGVRMHFEFRDLGRLPGNGTLLECRFHELILGNTRTDVAATAGRRRRLTIVDAARFEQAVDRELARTRDQGEPLSLLSIGIDRHVAVAGEGLAPLPRVLRGFAATCAGELRASDVVGEFNPSLLVALMPNTSAHGARRAAERLRSAIALMDRPKTQRQITVSIGTVTTRTGKSAYRQLRSRADAKREDASNSGGNRVNA